MPWLEIVRFAIRLGWRLAPSAIYLIIIETIKESRICDREVFRDVFLDVMLDTCWVPSSAGAARMESVAPQLAKDGASEAFRPFSRGRACCSPRRWRGYFYAADVGIIGNVASLSFEVVFLFEKSLLSRRLKL